MSTAVLGRQIQSSPRPRHTTVSHGFTRFSTATAVSRALCRTRCCSTRSILAPSGRSPAASRNVADYKGHLAACDQPRRGELDGRGNLSEEALVDFTRFFLRLCLDQVEFMESLVQPDRLRARILTWAEEEIRLGHLPPKSSVILEAILYRGELPRAEASGVVATGDRQARRIVSALLEHKVLMSDSTRAPLRLAFTAALASRWMPGLFPDRPD